MKYALIDMGSNSIRLTVYDVTQTNFKILFKEKIMAGLAGYVENGYLTQDGIDCACQSLREFQNTLKLLQIEHLAVFATASLRNITNTSHAVEQIRCATGIAVEILTGEAEAEYGFQGATCDIKIAGGLFADVGGASSELALFTGQQVEKAGSVPVGSLKLYRDCVKKILPGRASLRLCRKRFGLSEDCRTFTREQLDALAKELCRGDKAAADLILRYEPERIHTLVPGVMVLQYLADRYGVKDITVSHYGVREGYLRRKIQPSMSEIA